MACWYFKEMSFPEEFKYGIVILIHKGLKMSGPAGKELIHKIACGVSLVLKYYIQTHIFELQALYYN